MNDIDIQEIAFMVVILICAILIAASYHKRDYEANPILEATSQVVIEDVGLL